MHARKYFHYKKQEISKPKILNMILYFWMTTLHELSLFVSRCREWATCTPKALFIKTWSRRTFFMTPIRSWSQTLGCLGSLELSRRGGKKALKAQPQLKCCPHCAAVGAPVICNNCWVPQWLQSCRQLPHQPVLLKSPDSKNLNERLVLEVHSEHTTC